MLESGKQRHDDPIGYFLTWTTYGAWFPGDDRGWVKYRRGQQPPNSKTMFEAAARMSERACVLDEAERRVVEQAIAAHCQFRCWTLHAVNCRSNHVHVVVAAGEHPDIVCRQFKAWSTRRLKEHQQHVASSRISLDAPVRKRWWAARGSTRYLNDLESLEAAILYVRDAQDKPRT